MNLFVEQQRYKPLGTVVRRRDLFSHPGSLQLKGTPNAEACVARFSLEALTIGDVRSTGHEVEVCEAVGISLVVPLRGRIVSSVTGTTLRASEGEALLFSPNRRNTRVEAIGAHRFLGVPVIISADELKQTAMDLGVAHREILNRRDYSLKLSTWTSPASRELIQLVGVLHSEISRNAPGLAGAAKQKAWAQLLKEKFVEVLYDADLCSGLPKTDIVSATRHVRRAQDFMHAHYPTISGIAEVANSCGISIRSLQAAFKTVWSMTPQDMLLAIRLDAARQMLVHSEGEDGVTEIAFACGFSHLGRFAVAYRQRFAERPSETLRRASARP